MRLRSTSLIAAGLGLLVAASALAQQTRGSSRSMMDDDERAGDMMAEEKDDMTPRLGAKTYKERINTVARKPLHHDIDWLDSRDRTDWNGHTVWQGIRDERPLIARKTLGFHDPRPHRTRRERVLLISRGPIQGPGFAQ